MVLIHDNGVIINFEIPVCRSAGYGEPVAAKRPIIANKPQVSEKPKPQNGTSKINEATAPPTPARRAPVNEESDTYENFGSSLPDSNDILVSELHKVIRDEKENNPTNPFKEEFNVSSAWV